MHALFDLSNTVAVVTGGTRGIGLACATALAELGAKVVVTSEDAEACARVETDLRVRKLEVWGHKCDVGVREDLEALVAFTLKRFGKIDAVVSCAGVAPHFGPLVGASNEDWERTLRVNLQSNVWLCNMVFPHLQTHGGSIVFVSSISALRGNKNIGLYAISKAGLAQLARDLAIQGGPQNIRVNAIMPGLIRTDFARALLDNTEFMERRVAMTPLRRVGEVNDIAGVVAMLLAPAGQFITGQSIVVDGGTVVSDGV